MRHDPRRARRARAAADGQRQPQTVWQPQDSETEGGRESTSLLSTVLVPSCDDAGPDEVRAVPNTYADDALD